MVVLASGPGASTSSAAALSSFVWRSLSPMAMSLRKRLLDKGNVVVDCVKYFYRCRLYAGNLTTFGVALDASRLSKRSVLLGC